MSKSCACNDNNCGCSATSMNDLKRKMFADFDIPETPKSNDLISQAISIPKPKKKKQIEHSIPLNYRNYLSSAYKIFEEETLIKIESKQMKSHMGSMLDQCKAKQASQGDKLMLRLRTLLDYVPKSYKGWERSKMQKLFHRNFMQATCLHLYRH